MTERLPDSVAQIAEVIGVDAALKLVRQWPRATKCRTMPRGRIAIYVPATMPADHPIAAIIGHEAAQKLAEIFGGENLFPATCGAHATREAVIRALAVGAHTDMIARLFEITPQHVRLITKKVPASRCV